MSENDGAYEAWTVCRDADRWVDEDAVKLYRAAERLAAYVEELQGERDELRGESKRLLVERDKLRAALIRATGRTFESIEEEFGR